MKLREVIVRELVREWLDKAEEDYQLARYLVQEDAPFGSSIGFHCQQAAEKLLKAFLTYRQIEVPKTHSLGELLDLLTKTDGTLASSLRDATSLTPYGAAFRYPGVLDQELEKQEAFALATKVRDAILAALKDYLPESAS
jgi:HEPN domain-containing protein